MSNDSSVRGSAALASGEPDREQSRNPRELTLNPVPEDARGPGQGNGTGGGVMSTLMQPSPTAFNYRRSLFRR